MSHLYVSNLSAKRPRRSSTVARSYCAASSADATNILQSGKTGCHVDCVGNRRVINNRTLNFAAVLVNQAQRIAYFLVRNVDRVEPGLIGVVSADQQVNARFTPVDYTLQC